MGRRLLVVSPHFPPTDAVDMHRVRMNVGHYAENGFEPVVLAVEPSGAGRLVDSRLVGTVPDIEVVRVPALPERLTRWAGITDLSLRAMGPLARAGDRLLARGDVDLVLFSTTCFLTMQLGPRWLRRHGVPFVLDFQDPWHAAPESTLRYRRKGLKHRAMRVIHARSEARTVIAAAGFIAVADSYLAALGRAYPVLRTVPAAVIPFGHSDRDFAIAKEVGEPWRPFPDARRTALYAGRVGDSMAPSIGALFGAVRMAIDVGLEPLASLGFAFLGTGYQRSGNLPAVVRQAAANDLAGQVVERPDRLGLLDAFASLLAADVLIVLGSGDLAYQPSKLHQLLALNRPILCVAPAESRLAAQVRGLSTVAFLASDTPPDTARVQGLSQRLSALLALGPDHAAWWERKLIAARTSAATLAACECTLFDAALVRHGRRQQ